ncbi:YggS family pyridoxal phosphate-dependent enzyme, partial [Clostridium autoethanogenum]
MRIKKEKNIEKNVTLVAVSKTKPIEDIQKAYDAGIRDFGENKVQELTNKIPN